MGGVCVGWGVGWGVELEWADRGCGWRACLPAGRRPEARWAGGWPSSCPGGAHRLGSAQGLAGSNARDAGVLLQDGPNEP